MSVYGKGYFVSEQEKIDEKAMMESMLLEAANEGLYSIMEANFTILPTFKNTPALRKYESVAKEAEELLQEKGVDDKAYGTKIVRLIGRFLDILENVSSVLTIPAVLSIVYIPAYLVTRLISWALRWGQEKLAIKECDATITTYNKLLKEAKSKQEKDKLESAIKKIKDSKEKLEKSSSEFNVKVMED